MKRGLFFFVVFMLVHGCTCDLGSSGDTSAPCGDLGQPCCGGFSACLTVNGGCNRGLLFSADLACIDGTCEPCTDKTCPDFDGSRPDVDDDASACASGLACERCSLATFAPPSMGKPAAVAGACTEQEITDFVAACFGSSSSTSACNTWQAQTITSCATCLLSNASATRWGAVVCDASSCLPNQGGCIDLETGDVASELAQGGKGSCGDAMTAVQACHQFACGQCAENVYAKCDEAAGANECAALGDDTTSTTGVCAIINGDAAPSNIGACFPKDDTGNAAFANVFCGTGP